MGYQATFLARKRYAASDINSISTSLSLSSSSFTDETAYGVSDLNGITSSLVTAGVSSGCDVIKIDDTKLKVNTGTLFFSNGCRIDIDSDGVFLQYDSGEKYIYAFYDSTESGVSVNIADSLPESGDFVSLAKYDGTDITDLRTHAKAKVKLNADPGWNGTQILNVDFTTQMTEANTKYHDSTRGIRYEDTVEFDVQGDNFKYITHVNTFKTSGDTVDYNRVMPEYLYDIKKGSAIPVRAGAESDKILWDTRVWFYRDSGSGSSVKYPYYRSISTESKGEQLEFVSLSFGKLKLKYTVIGSSDYKNYGVNGINIKASFILF